MRLAVPLLFLPFFSLPLAANVPRECDASIQLAAFRIETVSEVGPLRLNGGESLDYGAILSLGNDFQRFAARAELYVARVASENGERFLGVTDVGVGRCVDAGYQPTVDGSFFPDLLSVATVGGNTVFRLREVKTGTLTPARLGHALGQLASGVEHLLRRIPDATVDVLEMVYVLRPDSRGDRHRLLAGSPASTIHVGTRAFRVTSRTMTPPADDPNLLSLVP